MSDPLSDPVSESVSEPAAPQTGPQTTPEPTAQPASRETAPEPGGPRRPIPRAALGVSILVLLLAGISVAVVLVSTGSGAQKGSAGAASTPGATARQAAQTGKESAGVARGPQPGGTTIRDTPVAAVSGPKPLKPTDPAKVKSWNAGTGGAALAQVTADSGNVLMAYGSGQYTQTLQACVELAGAVKRAGELPPIPNSSMQKMYVRSLDAFKAGIAECEAAITQHPEGVEDVVTDVNHTEMTKAIAQFSTGTKDLYVATEFLRKQ